MRAPERRRQLRGLLAATSFLTRVPLGGRAAEVTDHDLRAAAGWFPIVGGGVGLLAATVGWLVAMRAPATVAAVAAIAAEALATGAFHLDGLADTADGLGAASTGRDGLRVMREPTIGAFGAVAIALDLALRMSATAALLARGPFPWAIVAAAGPARLTPLVLASRLPYLRPEGGVGEWVGDGPARSALGLASASGLCVAALAGIAGIGIVVSVVAIAWVVGVVARRAFGGVTGDVFGAAAELTQTVAVGAVVLVTGR